MADIGQTLFMVLGYAMEIVANRGEVTTQLSLVGTGLSLAIWCWALGLTLIYLSMKSWMRWRNLD